MPIISGGGAAPAVKTATATLTHAQILALPTTPISVVAAPGSGKMVVPVFGVYYVTPFTTSYTNLAGLLALVLDATNNFNQVSAGVAASGLLTAFSNIPTVASDPGAWLDAANANRSRNLGSATNGFDNAALYVAATTGSGDFTGGTAGQTIRVTVYYVTVTL